jgi:2'-5' RNA ligase
MSGLFICIPVLADGAVESLKLAKRIWSDHDYIQWFEPESLHVTLGFVETSRISPKHLQNVVEVMQEVMERTLPKYHQFSAVLDQFDWFGAGETLVVTNPPKSTNRRLTMLARSIMGQLKERELRVRQSHDFRAHVSLGKRDICAIDSVYATRRHPTQLLPIRLDVDRLCLYQAVDNRHHYKVWHTAIITPPAQEQPQEREAVS